MRRNATLVAFAAAILNSSATKSSRSFQSGKSSHYRPCFVPAETTRRSRGGISHARSRSKSPRLPGAPRRAWTTNSQPSVIARYSRQSVAPRQYISSEGVDNKDVLVCSDVDGDFSFMRSYQAFNEVTLKEIFSSGEALKSHDELFAHHQSAHREERSEVVPESPFFFASINRPTSPEKVDPVQVRLPPWLTLNQGGFAAKKLRKLRRDLSSHLSSKESEDVASAILKASNGDVNKVAGAADFSSILVNSLEMTDVPALCASAFHYCSLVSVRERMVEPLKTQECSVEERICLKSGGPDAEYLCALAGSGIEDYGNHAVKIALDAARLKSMETLATSLVGKTGKLGYIDNIDAENLRSLLLSINDMGDWRALAIRSAACLYRLESLEAYRAMMSSMSSQRTRSPTIEETRASQEALHVYAPIAARLGMFRLKTDLEDAAFRTLYPHSHARVSALCGGENINNVGEGMRSILTDVTSCMKRLLQEDCSFMEHIENVSVSARVKEPYSTWRKILKINKEGVKHLKEISILDVPDAVALRVVFSARKLTPDESDTTTRRREKALCYYVQELCTEHWRETSDSRFKDYVEHPKENGYQSLHYSTRKRWRGIEWPFEVQIRSNDMHRVAEYGVAAHWRYKRKDINGRRVKHLDRSSKSYLRSVVAWRARQEPGFTSPESYSHPLNVLEEEIRRERKRQRNERLAPYLEALSGAQTDLARENVFVFVSIQHPCDKLSGESVSPGGTVLSLPRGSRVVDAIRVAQKWSDKHTGDSPRIFKEDNYMALRNGSPTSVVATETLSSGDVVSFSRLEFPQNESAS